VKSTSFLSWQLLEEHVVDLANAAEPAEIARERGNGESL